MIDHFDDTDRSFFCRRQPSWTDIAQIRDLRKLVALSRENLDNMRRHPVPNREQIEFEETMLEATLRKLRKLESRFFLA